MISYPCTVRVANKKPCRRPGWIANGIQAPFAKSGKHLAGTCPEIRRIKGDLARHGIHLRFIPADCVQCLPKQLFSLPFLGRQTIPAISRAMLIARANRTRRSIDIEVRTASPIGAVNIPNF